jgi:ectoine hydroxylase-related dioxygenase (phytanoyl-CoA dioxygenase family)
MPGQQLRSAPAMTDRQRYLFDLQGFVVVEDVLSHAECDLAIAKIRERMQPMAKTPDGYDSEGTWQVAGNLLEAGEPFLSLIDHEKTNAVLKAIIAPRLRLEGCYSFVRSKGCPVFEMHGGHQGGSVNFRYLAANDRIYTGLTVISFTLQEVTPEHGGFACIPGSHKSAFRLSPEDRKELFAFGGPLVRNVPSPKGSAVIFTETLAHGANSWQDETPRYGLFYKYNDRAAIYHEQGHRRPSDEALAQMSDAQKCYFNSAWEAFGPVGRPRNDVPEFGV